jgi:hypothetical protein
LTSDFNSLSNELELLSSVLARALHSNFKSGGRTSGERSTGTGHAFMAKTILSFTSLANYFLVLRD